MSKTNKLTGYFDCRNYKKGVERKARTMKADGETISVNTTFAAAELPAELAQYARKYTDKNGADRYGVEFKLSKSVMWFGADKQPTDRPLYSDIDGQKVEFVATYKQLDGDPSKLEAYGYWVNAIMFKLAPVNPFEDDEPLGEVAQTEAPAPAPVTKEAKADAKADAVKDQEEELPF